MILRLASYMQKLMFTFVVPQRRCVTRLQPFACSNCLSLPPPFRLQCPSEGSVVNMVTPTIVEEGSINSTKDAATSLNRAISVKERTISCETALTWPREMAKRARERRNHGGRGGRNYSGSGSHPSVFHSTVVIEDYVDNLKMNNVYYVPGPTLNLIFV